MAEIDWKRVALAAMACFSDHEGVVFESAWADYGIPPEWHEEILRELDAFEAERSRLERQP